MALQDEEVIAEFLAESAENLARLDGEMVAIERNPEDRERLASVFRTMHTIKGTCGFLGFDAIERLAHHAEAILGQIRSGARGWDAERIGLVFESADAIRRELASVERTQAESGERYTGLLGRLAAAVAAGGVAEAAGEGEARPGAGAERERGEVEIGGDRASVVPAGGGETRAAGAVGEETVRIGVGVLDRMMNLVGELVLARNQMLPYWSAGDDPQLQARGKRLSAITAQLQESMMRTRLLRIESAWARIPRMVRDIARELGKEIEVELDSGGTELDRTLIELIRDPLTHLVRNACDHGIETPAARRRAGKPAAGRLRLRAYHRGGRVVIEIGDDGAGIDAARVKASALEKGLIGREEAARMSTAELQGLIFRPGFSTAGAVTHLSGRGVGMDVVKTNVERMGGAVEVDSEPGRGTTVRLRIPLTLAILPGLTVRAGGERFIIAQSQIGELVRLEGPAVAAEVGWIHDAPVLRRHGALVPLAVLAGELGLDGPRRRDLGRAESLEIVVLETESRRFGVVVEAIEDSEEIVVKPLAPALRALAVYAGTAILGDGSVALILEATGLAERCGVDGMPGGEAAEEPGAPAERLLVCAGAGGRPLAVPLERVARLEMLPAGALEWAGGGWWTQYGGGMLPVEAPPGVEEVAEAAGAGRPMVVLECGGRRCGVLVEEIAEVMEAAGAVRWEGVSPGVAGTAVLGGRVTEVLDAAYYVGRREKRR